MEVLFQSTWAYVDVATYQVHKVCEACLLDYVNSILR